MLWRKRRRNRRERVAFRRSGGARSSRTAPSPRTRARQRGSRRDVARRATERGEDQKKGGEQFGVCAAGETVYASSRFRNPLEIPLALTEVSLRCAFEKKGRDTHSTFAEKSDTSEHVSIPKLDITLRPLETRLVRLACVPRLEGTLRVSGVSWRLRSRRRLRARRTRPKGLRRSVRGTSCRSTCARRARAERGRRRLDPRHAARETPRVACHAGDAAPGVPRVKRPGVEPAGAVAKITLVARNVAAAPGTHPTHVGFGRRSGRPRVWMSRPRRCACACVCPVRG